MSQSSCKQKAKSNKGTKVAVKPQSADKAKSCTLPCCCDCGVNIGDNTNALNCDMCKDIGAWKCIKCLCMPDWVYDHLKSANGTSLHWFCDECEQQIFSDFQKDDVKSILQKLLQKTDDIERKLSEKADTKDILEIEERLTKSLEDSAMFQAHAANQTTQAIIQPTGDIPQLAQVSNVSNAHQVPQRSIAQIVSEAVSQQADEEKDRERRKNNLIIYRAKESNSTDLEQRKESDLNYTTTLCSTVLNVRLEKDDIGKLIRLGKKTEESAERPRPLLVAFKDGAKKGEFLKNLWKLKNASNDFSCISVAQDLTPKQREETKIAVEQAKQQNKDSQGNVTFRVSGQSKPRVIKVKQQVPSSHGTMPSGTLVTSQ